MINLSPNMNSTLWIILWGTNQFVLVDDDVDDDDGGCAGSTGPERLYLSLESRETRKIKTKKKLIFFIWFTTTSSTIIIIIIIIINTTTNNNNNLLYTQMQILDLDIYRFFYSFCYYYYY